MQSDKHTHTVTNLARKQAGKRGHTHTHRHTTGHVIPSDTISKSTAADEGKCQRSALGATVGESPEASCARAESRMRAGPSLWFDLGNFRGSFARVASQVKVA